SPAGHRDGHHDAGSYERLYSLMRAAVRSARPFEDDGLAVPHEMDHSFLRAGVCFSRRHGSISAIRSRQEQERTVAISHYAWAMADLFGSHRRTRRRVL